MNHVGYNVNYKGTGRGALGLPATSGAYKRARGFGTRHGYAGKFVRPGKHRPKHPRTR
jgi:hypothetical protein